MRTHADVDERVAGDHAAFHRLLDAGVDRGDVLARDHATRDLVDELVAAARAGGLEADDDVSVLAAAAGLADVTLLDLLDRHCDRLAVRDLRLADVGLDAELAHHPVDEHLEVQLAHAADDRLAGLLVGVDLERRVLVGERAERLAQLVLVDSWSSARSRRRSPARGTPSARARSGARVAQRVTGGRLLEPEAGDDVAREHDVDVFAVVRVHAQDAADALACRSLVVL